VDFQLKVHTKCNKADGVYSLPDMFIVHVYHACQIKHNLKCLQLISMNYIKHRQWRSGGRGPSFSRQYYRDTLIEQSATLIEQSITLIEQSLYISFKNCT